MKKIIMIVLLLLVVGIIGFATYIVKSEYSGTLYYVKITTDGERFVDNGHVDYKYTLEGVNAHGETQVFNFRANRETPLTRDRYIVLEYNDKRGVLKWNGIEFEDMPKAAQNFFR